jgi:UPF0176 protein
MRALHAKRNPEPMPSLLVAAAYRFADLPDAASLREDLLASASRAALKGTLLIAPEGINFTLAGTPASLDDWLAQLQRDARFAELSIKRHEVDALPFARLKVKLKREIIRMDRPVLRPQDGRAPAVDAATLKRWLDNGRRDDEGHEVVLLDTRNAFEVDAGRFDGAVDWRLSKFSDFPSALEAHRADLAGRTVVSYCTGGIRCEKAALWMQSAGIERVLQLEGGILRFFEQAADSSGQVPHWDGSCFVFDERETLGGDLRASMQAKARQ